MEVLALIPARGGSKGVPGKNIRLFAGKPLINYTIEQCLAARQVTRVAVSTDDEEIVQVAKKAGAQVIERPDDISNDTATTESAVLHALGYLKNVENYVPDLIVILQATNPLRQLNDIDNAITKLLDEKSDSLLAAHYVHGFVWRDNPTQEPKALTYDYRLRPLRQEGSYDVIETGSLYVLKPEVIRKYNNRLGGKISIYRMKADDMFQVDEPEDIELMEQLLALRHANGTINK